MDNVKNFSISTVQVAPSPATSGASLTVSTGQGSLFPTGSFDLTMWPPNVQPNSFNAEIARCSFSGDVTTLTRAQYGTTAQAVGVGWQVAQNVTAQLLASGGSTPYAGDSPQNPAWLAPVKWAYVNYPSNIVGLSLPQFTIDPYTYSNGVLGVGATVTQNTPNAILSIDGSTPSVGDRVAFCDIQGGYAYCGIYTVTALGNGTSVPWNLTRATDNDTDATLGQYWATSVTNGVVFVRGVVSVAALFGAFTVGSSVVDLDVAGADARASGTSFSPGLQSRSVGIGAIALGISSIAEGALSAAVGSPSFTLGPTSVALKAASVAIGDASFSYVPGQIAWASGGSPGYMNALGNAQRTSIQIPGLTTDASPTAIGSTFQFVDATNAPIYTRTMIVRGRCVARCTSIPGTDSAWSFEGVLRGNGSSAYSWIGGSAPVPVVIAQDAGATAWAVGCDMDAAIHNQLNVTVMGSAATAISWECTLELDEVAG